MERACYTLQPRHATIVIFIFIFFIFLSHFFVELICDLRYVPNHHHNVGTIYVHRKENLSHRER